MPKIYIIPNAHLDPVWQWRWPEGCTEIRSTCRAACDFLDIDPRLTFCRSSAGDVRWLERCEPALLPRMAALVRKGQWESVGGWWTQPDCNIPFGESFVRQALYAQPWFRDVLGAAATVGYNVDSFGHHANLPQILRKCGLRYYVFMRPGPQENPAIPAGYFHWEGVDGSRVTAFHVFHPYNAGDQWGMDQALPECREYLARGLTQSAMLFVGMGDHGGGPTRRTLQAIDRLRSEKGMPELIYATPAQAFAAMEAEGANLPVYRGEMQIHAVGCYAAHSEVKALNRTAEETLLAAERMSVVAEALQCTPYPAAALREAWQDTLFNQFHDVLAGSSVRAAYADARDQYGRAIFTASEALNAAQQALAAAIDTRGDSQAVVFFNPHPFPVKTLYETGNILGGVFHDGLDPVRVAFFTQDGAQLPIQHVAPDVAAGWAQRYVLPLELPALGYRLLRIRGLPAPAALPLGVRADGRQLENERLTVSVRNEGIVICDRATGRVRVQDLRLLVLDDPSDTWGHDFERYDQVAGVMELVAVRVIENGPLRAGLRVEYRFGASRLWLTLLLAAGETAVEVRGRAWWMEKLRILKLAIPVPGARTTSMQEIPYAAIERPNNGKEWPIQQWADLSSGDVGVTVLNAGKYSMSVEGCELRPTLLRATPYVWSRCKAYPWPGENVAWSDEDWMIDQGVQEFRLRILCHDGDWRAAGVPEAARLFNRAPDMMIESAHAGSLPPEFSFLQVTGSGVRVEVLKRAEDGHGVILRAVETRGAPAQAQFVLPVLQAAWEAAFAPWEIKTFRVDAGSVCDAPMLEDGASENHV